ncbi:MAG: cytochrome c3 family protein [bacterium]
MKKSFWVVLTVLIIICVGAMVLQVGAKEAPDEMEINSDATHFKDGKKTKIPPAYNPPKLTHKKHAKEYGEGGYGCKVCHHEMKSDDPAEQAKAKNCSSEGCHGAEAKEKCLDLKTAMHDQCYKNCHKTDEKAIAAKAPTKCNDCHVKAEAK